MTSNTTTPPSTTLQNSPSRTTVRSSGSSAAPPRNSPKNVPRGSPLSSPMMGVAGGKRRSGAPPVVAPLNLEDINDPKSVFEEQEKPIKGAKRLGSAWKKEMMAANNNNAGLGSPRNNNSPRYSNVRRVSALPGGGGGGGVGPPRRTSFFRGHIPPTIQDGVPPSPHWDQDREARRLQRLEIQRVIANLPRFAAMARSKDPARLKEALTETQVKLWNDWEIGATELVNLRLVGRAFYLWQAATSKSIRRKKEILLELKLAELAKTKGGVAPRVRSFQNFGGGKMKKPPSFVMTQGLSVDTTNNSNTDPSNGIRQILQDGDTNARAGNSMPPTTPIINDMPTVGMSTTKLDPISPQSISPPPLNGEKERPKSKFFSFGMPRVLSRRGLPPPQPPQPQPPPNTG